MWLLAESTVHVEMSRGRGRGGGGGGSMDAGRGKCQVLRGWDRVEKLKKIFCDQAAGWTVRYVFYGVV